MASHFKKNGEGKLSLRWGHLRNVTGQRLAMEVFGGSVFQAEEQERRGSIALRL